MEAREGLLPLCPFSKEQAKGIGVSGMVTKKQRCLHALYRITGCAQSIVVSKKNAPTPTRQNGLWETTCFELFLKYPHTSEYVEFNFSPSGDWNAYHFSDYRKEMREFDDVENIKIEFTQSAEVSQLEATIQLKEKISLLDHPLSVGLCAVVETTLIRHDGQLSPASGPIILRKSYWALQHADLKPDFHLADSFTLII
ncbi:MAG: DOMON-like domain-containing protein [Bdellovibrionota bacterium]